MPYDAVYFWGPWSEKARHTIANVTRRYDAAHSLPPTVPGAGRPWVAVCHRFPDQKSYYFVSRAGIGHTFNGHTPGELVASIEDEIDTEA